MQVNDKMIWQVNDYTTLYCCDIVQDCLILTNRQLFLIMQVSHFVLYFHLTGENVDNHNELLLSHFKFRFMGLSEKSSPFIKQLCITDSNFCIIYLLFEDFLSGKLFDYF